MFGLCIHCVTYLYSVVTVGGDEDVRIASPVFDIYMYSVVTARGDKDVRIVPPVFDLPVQCSYSTR